MTTGAFHTAVQWGVTFTRLNACILFTGVDLLSWWRLPALNYYCTVHELCWQRHNSTSPSLLSLQIHRCVLSTCHCSVHKTTTKLQHLRSKTDWRVDISSAFSSKIEYIFTWGAHRRILLTKHHIFSNAMVLKRPCMYPKHNPNQPCTSHPVERYVTTAFETNWQFISQSVCSFQ